MNQDLLRRIKGLRARFPEFDEDLQRALQYLRDDPRSALGKCRLCAERLIRLLYELEHEALPDNPKQDPLAENRFIKRVDRLTLSHLRHARELGNFGVHDNQEDIGEGAAAAALLAVAEVLERVDEKYPLRPRRERPVSGGKPGSERAAPITHDSIPVLPRQVPRRRGLLLAATLALTGCAVWVMMDHLDVTPDESLVTRATRSVPAPVQVLREAPQAAPTHAPRPADPPAVAVAPTPRPAAPSEGSAPAARDLPRPTPEAPGLPFVPRTPMPAGPAEATWTPHTTGSRRTLYAIGGGHHAVYLAGADGILLRSTDGGATWQLQRTGTRNDLYSVAEAPDGTAYAVGAGGTVLRSPTTRDAPWTLTTLGTVVLRDAYADGASVYIVGDRGWTWQLSEGAEPVPLFAGSGDCLRAVRPGPGGQLYVAGDGGTLLRGLRSAPRALRWTRLDLGTEDPLWDVAVVGNAVLVIGEAINEERFKVVSIHRSVDGERFAQVALSAPANPMYRLAVLDDRRVYAAGLGASLLRSEDAGLSWHKETLDAPFGRPNPRIKLVMQALSSGDLFVLGDQGELLHRRIEGALLARP